MEPTNNNQNRQHQNVEDQGQLPQRDRSGVEDVPMDSRKRKTDRDGDTGKPPADEQSRSTENDDAIGDETDEEFEEDVDEEEDDDLDSEKAGE